MHGAVQPRRQPCRDRGARPRGTRGGRLSTTASPAPPATRDPRDGRPVRSCGGHRRRDRTRVPCTRRRPADPADTGSTGTGRTRQRATRTAGTPETLPPRIAAVPHRRASGPPRELTSRSGHARPDAAPPARGRAGVRARGQGYGLDRGEPVPAPRLPVSRHDHGRWIDVGDCRCQPERAGKWVCGAAHRRPTAPTAVAATAAGSSGGGTGRCPHSP
jgi:hypothetical protein